MSYLDYPIIYNAVFNNDSGILSYKELPVHKYITVSGTLEEENVSLIVKAFDNVLVTECGQKYTFVPKDASKLENAMDLKLTYFITDDDYTISLEDAKDELRGERKIYAVGNLISEHYRERKTSLSAQNKIHTNSINEIIEEGGTTYIKTSNSVYKLV